MMLVVALWFSMMAAHPVYVSVTNLDVDVEKSAVSLSLKVFTSDVETMLHNRYGIHTWMGSTHEHRDSRPKINEYLAERLKIRANENDDIALTTDSMIIHEEALWIYMQGKASAQIHSLTVENRVLTDFFKQQTNLVIVGIGTKETGYRLNRDNFKIELTL